MATYNAAWYGNYALEYIRFDRLVQFRIFRRIQAKIRNQQGYREIYSAGTVADIVMKGSARFEIKMYRFLFTVCALFLPYLTKVFASSETQGLLDGTMRYFRASDIFGLRAPGHFYLPNVFQKWSKSLPLIGQKSIFLANQRGRLAG